MATSLEVSQGGRLDSCYIFGPSTANVKIEVWWRYLFQGVVEYWTVSFPKCINHILYTITTTPLGPIDPPYWHAVPLRLITARENRTLSGPEEKPLPSICVRKSSPEKILKEESCPYLPRYCEGPLRGQGAAGPPLLMPLWGGSSSNSCPGSLQSLFKMQSLSQPVLL